MRCANGCRHKTPSPSTTPTPVTRTALCSAPDDARHPVRIPRGPAECRRAAELGDTGSPDSHPDLYGRRLADAAGRDGDGILADPADRPTGALDAGRVRRRPATSRPGRLTR